MKGGVAVEQEQETDRRVASAPSSFPHLANRSKKRQLTSKLHIRAKLVVSTLASRAGPAAHSRLESDSISELVRLDGGSNSNDDS